MKALTQKRSVSIAAFTGGLIGGLNHRIESLSRSIAGDYYIVAEILIACACGALVYVLLSAIFGQQKKEPSLGE